MNKVAPTPRWGPIPPPPQTTKELANVRCATANCKHQHDEDMYLHGRCHTYAPTCSRILTVQGIIEVWCSVCGLGIARFKIASEL